MLVNSRESLFFITRATFVDETRVLLAKQRSGPQNADPHLLLEWLMVVPETAMHQCAWVGLFRL